MLREQEPLKSVLKVFELYGFYRDGLSQRRQNCTAAYFSFSFHLMGFLVVLGLFESTDRNDFVARFLMAVTSVSIQMKALFMLKNMGRLEVFLDKLKQVVSDNNLTDQLETARRRPFVGRLFILHQQLWL
jgi:hypothetical protein